MNAENNPDSLGLPLEYQHWPAYFDAFNIGDDTAAKNAVVERVLRAHGVRTVLDLTCGTGSQVFFLTQHGYQVTGVDFSPSLLTIARQKAHDANVNVSFIDGDMRTSQVGTFDAVITIFNAIGHLTKADFAHALRNIHRNLKTGGLYVFDIFNLAALTDEVVANLAVQGSKKVHGAHVHWVQCSTLDRNAGQLTSYDHYIVQQHVETPQSVQHQFSLQLYTTLELTTLLASHGFDTLAHCSMDGADFVEDTTLSRLTIARKQ